MKTTSSSKGSKTLRRTIGVRDAKARLSELLRDAQLGHEWTITDRGKPIARITPIMTTKSLVERLVQLEKRGVIGPAHSQESELQAPLSLPPGLAQRILAEDRSSRD